MISNVLIGNHVAVASLELLSWNLPGDNEEKQNKTYKKATIVNVLAMISSGHYSYSQVFW
jgi:hypothetical protein